MSVEKLIQIFQMEAHPEGGYFKETYRAFESISKVALPERFNGDRSFSTGIYYLLPEGTKSSLHRIASDEMWHFYLGDPLVVVQFMPDGQVVETILGNEIERGQKVQHVVPAGCWFGAYPGPGSHFSFVGCTVAPGFDFGDFEMGNRDQLLKEYPSAKALIEKLMA
ncbi:MAG: cupin domain-containing protein [Deltaproteobacteria bacterium]|nr:cupin domain-containing protein [Deltaproteobacteria bacterium]